MGTGSLYRDRTQQWLGRGRAKQKPATLIGSKDAYGFSKREGNASKNMALVQPSKDSWVRSAYDSRH